MLVRMTENASDGVEIYHKGKEYDLDEQLAQRWLGFGFCVPPGEPPPLPGKSRVGRVVEPAEGEGEEG